MAANAILDFWNRKILLAIGVERVETHQHAKLCQNWSIGCEDIYIFQFFKMAATVIWIVEFSKFYLLAVFGGAIRITVPNFVQNRFFCCGDIAIFFQFSRWPPPPSWIFETAKFYWSLGSRGSRRICAPNFVKICQSVAKILRFFDFTRWRPSAILDLFGAYLDHPQWVLVDRYHSAKFGYDRCSSCYNMNISIFDAFGWKMPIHALKIGGFWAIWSPKWGAISTKDKKGTPLRESASFEPLSVKMWHERSDL